MSITRCVRCGGTDVHRGILPITMFPYIVELCWKSESPGMIEDEKVTAFLCKSCGHIELVATSNIIGQKIQQTCPYCKARYIYRIPSDVNEKMVECQNCGKKFIIKIYDVLDDIEQEFKE